MSIDQRIREGLTMIDQELPPPDVHAAHEVVVQDGRRLTRRRRAAVLVSAAAVAAGVFAATRVGGDDGATPTPTGPPTSGATSSAPAPASPLEGGYRSTPVTFSDMAATLRASGLADEVPALRARLGDFGTQRLRLSLRDGIARLRVPGAAAVDEHGYAIGAFQLQLTSTDTAGPLTRYTTTTTPPATDGVGPTLTLTFVDTTEGVSQGVSGEAWQRALYTTVPFQEVSD